MLKNNLKLRDWNVSQETLQAPLLWGKSERVHVHVNGDLFDDVVPFGLIDQVFQIMSCCPRHTFLIETKNPRRMKEYLGNIVRPRTRPNCQTPNLGGRPVEQFTNEFMASREYRYTSSPAVDLNTTIEPFLRKRYGWSESGWYQKRRHDLIDNHFRAGWPLPNVWLGVPVSNQAEADERVSWLLTCPAALRFVHCAPLLEKVNLDPGICQMCHWNGPADIAEAEDGTPCCDECGHEVAFGNWLNSDAINENGIGWVIAGGMVGPDATPSHPDWFRLLRDQCVAAEAPLFFEGWGEFVARKLHHEPTKCTADNWGTLDIEGHWYPTATPWNGRQGEASETREYTMVRVGQKEAGRLLDGQTWEEWPALREEKGDK